MAHCWRCGTLVPMLAQSLRSKENSHISHCLKCYADLRSLRKDDEIQDTVQKNPKTNFSLRKIK